MGSVAYFDKHRVRIKVCKIAYRPTYTPNHRPSMVYAPSHIQISSHWPNMTICCMPCFFLLLLLLLFFSNLIKLYQEFLQRAIRFSPISNSKIPHIWCIVGLKRGKINALWDTFYHLFNPIMHHIHSTMYKMWYSLLQYWASCYESTLIAALNYDN